MSNVIAGDLAIVIKVGTAHPDCLGRIVKVIEWHPVPNGWVIEFVGDRPASYSPRATCCSPDHALRPVSGLPDADDTHLILEKPITEPA